MSVLAGKHILVGVSGSIAAFKVAGLVSKLVEAGASVQVMMTAAAKQFVTPLTFETLSHQPVLSQMFSEAANGEGEIRHIQTTRQADLILVAPATANILGKLAHGLADDLLSTTLLAATVPIMVAPAMNPVMYEHPAVQENIHILKERGVQCIEPGVGLMACGEIGEGRLAEPEAIFTALTAHFEKGAPPAQSWAGYRVLVTAGPTYEPIDPVRFLGNRSSGKMGYAIATKAHCRGATVTLISGPTSLPPPEGIHVIRVETTEEMLAAVLANFDAQDMVVMAAAPADYRPVARAPLKLHKQGKDIPLLLTENPDILHALHERRRHQCLVGFAAETDDLEASAQRKLQMKQLDVMVGNPVGVRGMGFDSDENQGILFTKDGKRIELPLQSKQEMARTLLDLLFPYLPVLA